MKGPTLHPFLKAFTIAVLFSIISAIAISTNATAEGEQLGRLFGLAIGLTGLTAIITGFLARRSKIVWSWMKTFFVFIGVMLVLAFFFLVSKLPPRT